MAAMLDTGMPSFLSHRLFAACDTGGEETLGLEDFVCAMAVITMGTPREKASLLFACYDVDKADELYTDRLAYFIGLVYSDRPQTAVENNRVALAVIESAKGRYSERLTKAEWLAWAVKASETGAWARAPLLLWLDRVADVLVPEPLMDALTHR
jgi:Ca2+-binding EF-hand superfamily protein